MPSSQINVVPVGDTIVLTGQVQSAGDALQAMDIAKGFVSTSAVGAAAVAGQVVNLTHREGQGPGHAPRDRGRDPARWC